MIALLIEALKVILPLLHLAFSKVPRTPQRVVHILLLYALVLGVGVIGLPMGFIPHVFFPDQAAAHWLGAEPISSSKWGSMTVPGVFSVSSASGSAVCSGSRAGSAGRSSCSAPPTATSARP